MDWMEGEPGEGERKRSCWRMGILYRVLFSVFWNRSGSGCWLMLQVSFQETSGWLQKEGSWVSKVSQFPIPPVGGGKFGKLGKRPFCVHSSQIWESWEIWESGGHLERLFTGDGIGTVVWQMLCRSQLRGRFLPQRLGDRICRSRSRGSSRSRQSPQQRVAVSRMTAVSWGALMR